MALPNFNALRDLHNSANDLLHSPEIQQVLVNQKQEKWLHENLKKETLKSLKGMKGKSDISNVDHSIMVVVVEVLREVRVATITIVVSHFNSMSGPRIELRVSYKSLYGFCDETALHSANKRLEGVEIAVEDLEVELECMTRQGSNKEKPHHARSLSENQKLNSKAQRGYSYGSVARI
uniref:Uncharacterized protein n=1 Tax=Salix viminalis TaxID=40686 RepID=A0A6N2LFE6_SALVM